MNYKFLYYSLDGQVINSSVFNLAFEKFSNLHLVDFFPDVSFKLRNYSTNLLKLMPLKSWENFFTPEFTDFIIYEQVEAEPKKEGKLKRHWNPRSIFLPFGCTVGSVIFARNSFFI